MDERTEKKTGERRREIEDRKVGTGNSIYLLRLKM